VTIDGSLLAANLTSDIAGYPGTISMRRVCECMEIMSVFDCLDYCNGRITI